MEGPAPTLVPIKPQLFESIYDACNVRYVIQQIYLHTNLFFYILFKTMELGPVVI
jgi:hypothetical protein